MQNQRVLAEIKTAIDLRQSHLESAAMRALQDPDVVTYFDQDGSTSPQVQSAVEALGTQLAQVVSQEQAFENVAKATSPSRQGKIIAASPVT